MLVYLTCMGGETTADIKWFFEWFLKAWSLGLKGMSLKSINLMFKSLNWLPITFRNIPDFSIWPAFGPLVTTLLSPFTPLLPCPLPTRLKGLLAFVKCIGHEMASGSPCLFFHLPIIHTLYSSLHWYLCSNMNFSDRLSFFWMLYSKTDDRNPSAEEGSPVWRLSQALRQTTAAIPHRYDCDCELARPVWKTLDNIY